MTAMRTLAAAYPERSTQPVTVITPTGQADETLAEVRGTQGVASAERGRSGGGFEVAAEFPLPGHHDARDTATPATAKETAQ